MQHRFFAACAAAYAVYLSSFGAVQAATVNIVRDDAVRFETVHGLRTNTAADGNDIDGAQITALYADGSSEQITWEGDPSIWTNPDGSTYGSTDGWARGDDVDMFMSWDGFEMSTTRLLTSLTIDMAPANAVFDTTFDFDHSGLSTVGSGHGYAFYLYDGYEALAGSITAQYSGIVNLVGEQAVGDLFTKMTVDFSGLEHGGIQGNLDFRSDIDMMRFEADLISPVPLSSSMSFLLLGLGGLGISRRAKKRSL